MKYYFPAGRRNHGRPLKRLLDKWDRNGSTSDPTPWRIYDDNDDDDDDDDDISKWFYCEKTTSYMEELFIHLSSCTLNYDYFVILPTDRLICCTLFQT
jgi:hypothetical protein